MQLSNEEKNRIGDAATAMMQAFCEFRIAEDRLQTMGNLAGTLLRMNLFNGGQGADGTDVKTAILQPYVDAFKKKQLEFFDAIGTGLDNKEFWDWCEKREKERVAST